MFKLFLPIIILSLLVTPTYGAQIEGKVTDSVAHWIVPDRVYQMAVKWTECEPVMGPFNCPDHYRQSVSRLKPNPIILGVKIAPEYAREYPDNYGSPVKLEYCTRYGEFLVYLQEQFSPEYMELFNEPDVPLKIGEQFGQYFGAWVVNGDFYNSGRYYGECMEIATTRVKELNPNVRVILGALLGETTSLDFLRGALLMDNNYDAVSFHKYIFNDKEFDNAFKFADSIRSITNKPIIMTETSVLKDGEETPEHMALQAQYLNYLIQFYKESNISFFLWYTLANNGWRNSDLVFENTAKPAYYVFANYPGMGGAGEVPKPDYILIVTLIVLILTTIGYIYFNRVMIKKLIKRDKDDS